jgi:hypothetical protein
MKKIALLLLIIVSACEYDDVPKTNCGVKDPANDLPWLKDKIDELERSSLHPYFRVEQVEYNGETGFYVSDCCPFCDTFPIFYKCSGEAVTNIDTSKLVRKGIIWKAADYACMN